MADPAFVTLGSVPFLLIRGLPRVAALQACFIQPPGINGYTTVNNDQNSPVAYYSSVVNNNTNVALGVKIGPGVQCLMALPYRLPTNITVLDASGIVPHRAQTIILHSLVSILPYAVSQCKISNLLIAPKLSISYTHFCNYAFPIKLGLLNTSKLLIIKLSSC